MDVIFIFSNFNDKLDRIFNFIWEILFVSITSNLYSDIWTVPMIVL